jgi:uncharacterized protein (DUF779 family)
MVFTVNGRVDLGIRFRPRFWIDVDETRGIKFGINKAREVQNMIRADNCAVKTNET